MRYQHQWNGGNCSNHHQNEKKPSYCVLHPAIGVLVEDLPVARDF